MFESLKNIELTEEQAKDLKVFLEDYKKKLEKKINEDIEVKNKNEQIKFLDEVKQIVSKKIKKIVETKDKEIKKLKQLNEQKMADLISVIQEKTEKKIIKENVENDPIYIAFDKIKNIISPYVNYNLPNISINENKELNVKNNFDETIQYLKKLNIKNPIAILENLNLFESDIKSQIDNKIQKLGLVKEQDEKKVKDLDIKKVDTKNIIKGINMEKNTNHNLKIKQKILESVIRNIDAPLAVVYKNFKENKKEVFKYLKENQISQLYLILSEGKKKGTKKKDIKKPIKKINSKKKNNKKEMTTFYKPESKKIENTDKSLTESKNVEKSSDEKKQETFDRFMDPLKRNISL